MMDDLENGWLENVPDAPWNLTEDVSEWLEEFRTVCENLGIERDDPDTRAEAERELRDMAQDVLSGLMEVGIFPVYVVIEEYGNDTQVQSVYLHESMAERMARVLNDATLLRRYHVEEHEVM